MRLMKLCGLPVFCLLLACGDDHKRTPSGEGEPDLDASSVDTTGDAGRDGGMDAARPTGPAAPTDASVDAGGDSAALTPGLSTDGALDARVPDLTAVDAAAGDTCADGLPRGAGGGAQKQLADVNPTIEGVTVCPGGRVFVASASTAELWRVPTDGSALEAWGRADGRMFAGVTCDAKGRLFAADFGLTGSSTKRAAVMFSAKDAVAVLPDPSDGTELGGLNGIAAVPGQGVYASDTTGGLIVHYREHADGSFDASIAARGLPGANGLAYNPQNARLYLALSDYLGGENKIVSLAVAADGTLTDQRTDWTGSEVVDGVAVDAQGELYLALWARGTIIRASDRAVVGQTNNAASLAFRGGDLLFTDYDVVSSQVEGTVGVPVSASGLYSVALGVCGAL